MGNGATETLEFTPFYNALVGGRGTGKSTIVQALRLAYRRDEDMKRFREGAELRRQFERFSKVLRSRDGDGALREDTEICVTLMREGCGAPFAVAARRSRRRGRRAEQQWSMENFALAVRSLAERFPIRLLSQGQIAAMAADNRQALLDIIDEAADVGELRSAFDEELREYYSLCARLRVLEGRVAGWPELQRKLTDAKRQLEAFSQSQHADVLKAHQRAERQRREIDETLMQLQAVPGRIEAIARDLLLDDWPSGVFDDSAGCRYPGMAGGDRACRVRSPPDIGRRGRSPLSQNKSPRLRRSAHPMGTAFRRGAKELRGATDPARRARRD